MTPDLARLAREIAQQVAELPDRTSPEDWPEAMLVTADELVAIIEAGLAAALQDQQAQRKKLEQAIREHRDAKGDDRCWMDDEALYRVLPEGYTPPARDTVVELKRCEQFIASRHNPATVYVSPQRRIEQLEAQVLALTTAREEQVTKLQRRIEQWRMTGGGWPIENMAELIEDLIMVLERPRPPAAQTERAK